jgi:hypothetical protein
MSVSLQQRKRLQLLKPHHLAAAVVGVSEAVSLPAVAPLTVSVFVLSLDEPPPCFTSTTITTTMTTRRTRAKAAQIFRLCRAAAAESFAFLTSPNPASTS